MIKCICYHEDTKAEPRYSIYTGEYVCSVNVKYCYCSGTKERGECSCGGNRAKCDFYPEIRKKAIEETEIKSETEAISGVPINRGDLSDWCISSIGVSEPIWTDKLFEDFYLIPKE